MCLFLFLGDGTDEQPFVTDREKASGYETNLYLYSVSVTENFLPTAHVMESLRLC
jgi:hypothetical protein